MPILNPVRQYQPLDPYHHVADNGPIVDLVKNVAFVNAAVDRHDDVLAASIGTQGTLASRLARSINPDGSLKTAAIDEALHGIDGHYDTNAFVRMTVAERDKVSNIAVQATDLKIEIHCPSTTVLYDSGTMSVKASNSITWRSDNQGIYADVAFPLTARHRHYYDVTPVPVNALTPDFMTYHTTSVATAYAAGSLRVHVNGVRISHLDVSVGATADVKFPRHGGSTTWVTLNYNEDVAHVTSGIVTTGLFTLSAAILDTDRITIDFDVTLT